MNDNTGMDIASIRRARLRHLIDTDYEGSQAAFVERTGINQGELSGLLRKKSFGEKRARSLEVAAGLPRMYLDNPGEDQVMVRPETEVLSREQRQMLSLMSRIDKDARSALLKVGELLSKKSPERRKKDVGHNPERRLGPNIPPDTHDTRLFEQSPEGEAEQLQERKKR